MANKLFLSLLRDKWVIDPAYATMQIDFANAILSGKSVSLSENPKPEIEADIISIKSNGGGDTSVSNNIAVIEIVGAITRYDTPCGYGAETYLNIINWALNNPQIQAIVLKIDSPGGASTGATVLAERIKTRNKPIVAHISHGYAASAAYWFASQCDEIWMEYKFDSVGSIGAYCVLAEDKGALEKQGYKVEVIYAPQSTDKNGEVKDVFENNDKSKIEAGLFDLVETFISDVKSGRGARLKSDEMFTGKMFDQQDAIKNGMADGQGDLKHVLMRASELAKKQSTNSNSNKMSKQTLSLVAISAVLGWQQGFETTDAGLHLQTEEAQTLENHIANLESQAKTDKQALIDAQAKIDQMTADLQKANDAKAQLEADLQSEKDAKVAIEADLQTAQQEAASQKALAEKYGGQASGNGTTQKVTEDPPPITATVADDPLTAMAKARYPKK